MKALIVSLMLTMGLMFSVQAKADPTTFVLGAAFGYALNADTYKACDSKPYKTVTHAKGSNYSFSVSQCEFNANPGKYTEK